MILLFSKGGYVFNRFQEVQFVLQSCYVVIDCIAVSMVKKRAAKYHEFSQRQGDGA